MKTKQFEDYTDEEICRLLELGIAVLPNLKQGPLATFNSLTIEVHDNIIIIFGNLSDGAGGAMKIFTTSEQVNRFIDNLTQTRDMVFPE